MSAISGEAMVRDGCKRVRFAAARTDGVHGCVAPPTTLGRSLLLVLFPNDPFNGL
jgi:hypothetical protein